MDKHAPDNRLRSAGGAAIVVDVGVDHGISVRRLLRGSELSEAQLRDSTAEIQTWQEMAVIRNLLESSESSGLGLEAGLRYTIVSTGAWAQAFEYCSTLRQAIQLGIRYSELTHSFCRMSLRDAVDDVEFHVEADGLPEDVRIFSIERSLCAGLMMYRAVVPEVPVTRLALNYPRPPGRARYAEISGVEPVFDAAESFAGLDRTLMDMPLARANASTARWYEQQARNLLGQRRPGTGFAGRTREFLLDNPNHIPSAVETAAHFEISVRSLNRRLTAEGVTFRELLEQTREQLAEEMLRAGYSVEQTSRRLGYAEPASFQHAFRRWKGISPGRYARTK
ncbi:AraC family transcriptional regulator [Nocardia sp. 2]|uniref:AraC family transcriptional regulator n=1 Tax=Nocardia acididurans TaxID=2802282 RepID=A0ABS1MG28_9NOCA|nr:AraC family transcriptional regulator [Nocardia acididurans]MBL1079608.1 AraC family transcriptional regulator [Nocardia acididurans]